jgi:hypothetical protein
MTPVARIEMKGSEDLPYIINGSSAMNELSNIE